MRKEYFWKILYEGTAWGAYENVTGIIRIVTGKEQAL